MANNTLIILNPNFKPANFDYSDKNFERSPRADIATSNISFQFIENPQNINFTQMGSVKVFTNAPIYETPEMKSGVIRFAKNNKVDILSRVNDMCYKVRSENIEGYLWAGWFCLLKKLPP